MEKMRLNKFISTHTEYSRRKADELIDSGIVLINGKTVAQLGTQIDPIIDRITIKNVPVTPSDSFTYIALNKPKGYITTRSDELNRKTVLELIPKDKTLKPAGRLDKDTEGLLILSNDGDFINTLTHPKNECGKHYNIRLSGELTTEQKEKLERGVRIDGRRTYPSEITITKISPTGTLLKMVIHEGRNRQIRKMFASINHTVKYLQRTRIGKIKLGTLALGKYRRLNPKEINAYKST